MMDDVGSNLTLGEAARRFLTSLPAERAGESQQAVYRFVRWYGWENPCVEVAAPEVANYAEQLSLSDRDYAAKLELIRAFLTYARKQGWIGTNLAVHLKIKKGKTKPQSQAASVSPKAMLLTREGYAGLEAELAQLKDKRSQTIEEIRRAAADKDFRENAPLAAAKLVQLTDSDKEETARKACLDIISMLQIANHSSQVANFDTSESQITPQLSDQTVGRLLAILAEEKID